MTEKEKALAGLEFICGGKELRQQRDAAEALCFQLNNTPPADAEAREEILRQLLPDRGEGCYIKSPFICEYGTYIKVGKNFFANYNCKLVDGGQITFGDNEHILCKALILWVCNFITDHPCNQHSHDGRFPAAGTKLGT